MQLAWVLLAALAVAGRGTWSRRTREAAHVAVADLLLALRVTPADKQDWAQVGVLAAEVQQFTGAAVEVAFVDQGDTGEHPVAAAAEHGIAVAVVKLPENKRGFVLLLRRWVIEESFAWATRIWCLAKDYERLPQTGAGLHFVAFACLILGRLVTAVAQSP